MRGGGRVVVVVVLVLVLVVDLVGRKRNLETEMGDAE